MLRLHDAHNHLQDERFGGCQEELIEACRGEGVVAMVVNGACESDWPAVAGLARSHPDLVIPSLGYHPWYVGERTSAWREAFERALRETPGTVVGEIGLDRWKPGLELVAQEQVFVWQLRLAAERGLPASIHCLRAWGRLFDLLRAQPRPSRGFLLHSYGGPVEMVEPLARLGAYFSLPGYFAHDRKQRQRETFRHVPAERLLIETDAPDQGLPAARVRHRVPGDPAADGACPLNHPANLRAVYDFAAELLGRSLDDLAAQVEANFTRLFGRPLGAPSPAPAARPPVPPPGLLPRIQTPR
jgi:TatD DNase family protein